MLMMLLGLCGLVRLVLANLLRKPIGKEYSATTGERDASTLSAEASASVAFDNLTLANVVSYQQRPLYSSAVLAPCVPVFHVYSIQLSYSTNGFSLGIFHRAAWLERDSFRVICYLETSSSLAISCGGGH